MAESPTERAERLAADWSPVLGGPIGLAKCGCPNRIDGAPPSLHLCRTCGFVDDVEVHVACRGCAYRREGELATWEFCDHPDCLERPEAGWRRFCAPHRVEHAEKLLRQLRQLVAEHDPAALVDFPELD